MEKQAEKRNMNEKNAREPESESGRASPHSSQAAAQTSGLSRRSGSFSRNVLVVAAVLAVLVCLFFGMKWFQYRLTHVSTDDARVKGDMVTVSSAVQGRIRTLAFHEGERVEAGQVIAQLQDDDLRARVDMAAAAVKAAQAELKEAEELFTAERQKKQKELGRETSALDAARSRLGALQARRVATAGRPRPSTKGHVSYETGSIEESEPDQGRPVGADSVVRQIEQAGSEVRQKEAELEAAKAAAGGSGAREQRIEVLKAKLAEAQAGLASANLKLAAASISSPISGVIARKAANTGEIIKPGQAIAVVVNLDHLWIEANLEETAFGRIRPGQLADLKVDAYPGLVFTGTVVNIGAAAASVFSLLPENRSSGSFTKVTQRIPVRIEVSDTEHLLRPGMMISVGIDLRTGRGDTVTGSGKIEPPVKPEAGR